MSDADHRPMSKAELEAYIADDFIPAMRKMLPMIAPLPEWQPIETAPKDGTMIVGHDWCRGIGIYGHDDTHIMSFKDGEWFGKDTCENHFPTHWMPLLNPPNP